MHSSVNTGNSPNNSVPRFSQSENVARETTACEAQPHQRSFRIYEWVDLIGKGRS